MKKYVVFLLVLAAGTTGYFMKSEEETMGEYALADRLKVPSAEEISEEAGGVLVTVTCVCRRSTGQILMRICWKCLTLSGWMRN